MFADVMSEVHSPDDKCKKECLEKLDHFLHFLFHHVKPKLDRTRVIKKN